MSIANAIRRVLLLLGFVGAAILTGCAGMPARDVGAIAGAAIGAEGNPKRPILGAVRAGALGYGLGMLYERHVGPALGDTRMPGAQGSYQRGHQPGRYMYGEVELTRCNTRIERDYRKTGSPSMRVMTCTSERSEVVHGGTLKCSARYVERQAGDKAPEVTVDNERCTETVHVPAYRRY